jgi:transposase
MISLPPGARVWLACGRTDMRKGIDGLAMLAQQVLAEDPFGGALFAFRGKRGGWSNCFGAMGRACACSASGWRRGTSSGL